MNRSAAPEVRAESLVSVDCKVPGGPWFVRLNGPASPPVLLGPYENPSAARADAKKLRRFLVAVLHEVGPVPPAG